MDAGTHVALTMGITHGTLMLLAVRELWLLRRDARRSGGPGRRSPGEPVLPVAPTDGGSPPAPTPPPPPRREIPLPDCLIPKRARVLEDA